MREGINGHIGQRIQAGRQQKKIGLLVCDVKGRCFIREEALVVAPASRVCL